MEISREGGSFLLVSLATEAGGVSSHWLDDVKEACIEAVTYE